MHSFRRILWPASLATLLVVVVAALPSGSHARSHHRLAAEQSSRPAERPAPQPAVDPRPNIVFVLTDDLSWNLVRFMPEVQRMRRRGATFRNYFVTSPLCCSSRASIFTGQYPHNTGVLRNTPPHGGFQAYRRYVRDRNFAAQLKRSGYRTAFLGKFLNGYRARRDRALPEWDLWFANGLGYKNFDYTMRSRTSSPKSHANGRVVHFGWRPRDYMVDVLRRRGERFIRANAGRPFFIEFSTFTPHLPAVPAPRDRGRFKNLRLPRDGSFDKQVSGAPHWLADLPRLNGSHLAKLTHDWRRRARTVLAIDDLLRSVRKTVAAQGIADNTYIVFSSDNGYHLGEHRLVAGKRSAFDHDIKVPLMVVGPGVAPKSEIPQLAANIDLAPTFLRMASVQPPARTDGVSLLGLLHGDEPRRWRDELLIEYHKAVPGPFIDPDASDIFFRRPPNYSALRTTTGLYVENRTGEREYYDLFSDPLELENRYRSLSPVERQRLHRALRRLDTCAGAACRRRTPVWPPW